MNGDNRRNISGLGERMFLNSWHAHPLRGFGRRICCRDPQAGRPCHKHVQCGDCLTDQYMEASRLCSQRATSNGNHGQLNVIGWIKSS